MYEFKHTCMDSNVPNRIHVIILYIFRNKGTMVLFYVRQKVVWGTKCPLFL